MNLKPNKHKRISFNTTTMASLGFITPPLKFSSPQIQSFAQVPPKIRGAATMMVLKDRVYVLPFIFPSVCKFSRNWLIIFF